MDSFKGSTAAVVSGVNAPPESSDSQPSLPPTRFLAHDSNPNIVDMSAQSVLLVNPSTADPTLPASGSPTVGTSVHQPVIDPMNNSERGPASTTSRSTSSPRPEAVQIDEMCPSCLSPNIPLPPGYQKRSKEFRKNEDILIWISCSHCEDWYHWPCVRSRNQGIPSALEEDKGDWKAQVEMIDKWYCPNPICSGPTSGHIPTLKPHPSRRASSRPKPVVDYNAPSPPLTQSSPDWISLYREFEAQGRIMTGDYTEMLGPDVNLQWLIRDGCASGWYERHNQGEGPWAKPIVVREVQGAPAGAGIESLGGKMPNRSLTVAEIAELNGRDTKVEVMNVSNQSSSKNPPGKEKSGSEEQKEREKGHGGWTLGDWSDYFQKDKETRGGEVFNVISYEVSGTKVGDLITPPKIVRDLDWTTRVWPTSDAKHKPKVQLYCLMSPAGSFTDWHVDFAASSVYYHVMSGQKIFYLIRPTSKNLDAYTRWSSSENQAISYLGDRVKETVWKVTLSAGDTMFIPSGYIHAVYTPVDTLVFGGNFLHSYNIPMQLKLQDIEIATEVPKKFRFPHFNKLCWHVAEHYRRELQARQKIKTSRKTSHPTPNLAPSSLNDSVSYLVTEPFTPRLLDNLCCLSVYLMRQVRPRERGLNVDSAEPEFPFDKIKDPGAVARELRWRVRKAMDDESEDETEDYTAIPQKSMNRDSSKENRDSEEVSSTKSRTPASAPTPVESIGGSGKRRLSLETRMDETSLKKQKVEGDKTVDVVSKDSSPWDADEISQPIIRTRTVTLPRPGGSNARPEQALELYRSESQIRTRKRAMPDGGIVVEYSGTTKVVVKTTWAPPGGEGVGGKGNDRAVFSHSNPIYPTQQANPSGSYLSPPLNAPNPYIPRPTHPTQPQRPQPVQPVRSPMPSTSIDSTPTSGLQRPPYPVQAQTNAISPLPPPLQQHQRFPLRQEHQQIHQQPQRQRPMYPNQLPDGYAAPSFNHPMNSIQRPPAASSGMVLGGPRPISLNGTQISVGQTDGSRLQPPPPLPAPSSTLSDLHSIPNQPFPHPIPRYHAGLPSQNQLQRQTVRPPTVRSVHPPKPFNSVPLSQQTSLSENLVANPAISSPLVHPAPPESTLSSSQRREPPVPPFPVLETGVTASVPVKGAGPDVAQSSGLGHPSPVVLAVEPVAPSASAKSPSTRAKAVKVVPISDSVSAPMTRSAHVQAAQVASPSPKTPTTAKAPQSSSPQAQKSSPAMTMSLRNHPPPPVVPSVLAPTTEAPQASNSTLKAKPTATPKKVVPPLTKSTPMATRQRSSGGQQPVTSSTQSTEGKSVLTSEVVNTSGSTTPAPVTTSSENKRTTRSSGAKMTNMASSSPIKTGKVAAEVSTAMEVDADDSLSELSEEGG
ncbi:F-box protein JEMMA and related proteins with JmjC, PHD, F-box and LRR domains [Phaffia rhodozyma]|uniref:JmjC domain-containing histone demethylation protein 1 n=1 Tax=Phaffia rhodozyma TaxID=264483 RepID=A0A0F7SRF5_PHARH|nr:F-box protein JEMMA and related proteins with JmjC, PHD, F-box and LRR domains [Phaffia rhodozyma]